MFAKYYWHSGEIYGSVLKWHYREWWGECSLIGQILHFYCKRGRAQNYPGIRLYNYLVGIFDFLSVCLCFIFWIFVCFSVFLFSFFIFVFLSFCLFVFLSFRVGITLIKCLKGLKSLFVFKFYSGTHSVTDSERVGIEQPGQLRKDIAGQSARGIYAN